MTTDTVGGVWRYATSLATALGDLGVEVHLVTLGRRMSSDQRADIAGSGIRVIETDLALEWQDPEGRDVDEARRVLHAIACDVEPDVVHLNSFREATFDWEAPVLVVTHSCVGSWGLACNETQFLQDPQWQCYSARVTEGLRRAAAWVAPSSAFGEVVGRLYDPPRPRRLIWNGIASRDDLPANKQMVVLAAGRMWDKAKNVRALAEIAAGCPCPIHVAGSGLDRAGSAEHLHALGELAHAELQQRMSHAAIFVSPALYEPFGLSVLEAAAAGCALVLSDIPTFRELWQDAAVFVPPGDISALRSTLHWLAADQPARRVLQETARQRSRRYSLRRAAKAYVDLYSELLATASPDPHSNIPAEAFA
ncbi:glycosyltransferase family 4 protein [Bradyrhizobium sp. SRS-191]|uniref:glycosyltransferase family 4 protein n=1 Tax=Bradyrhizobium sp. SRS-191 TaxID=2962606 RepID=UPI00211E49DE|nr:glycosyltransferase family 4 protein [Bradyrhizobium sp. SRS-191]